MVTDEQAALTCHQCCDQAGQIPLHVVLQYGSECEQLNKEVEKSLQTLYDDFFALTNKAEDLLREKNVELSVITRRLRMLPDSIKKYMQQTGETSHLNIRQRALSAETSKQLFDNLTELKHWNFMTPEILTHIVKDVSLEEVHFKIDMYMRKLVDFKTKTKLKDLIGLQFHLPDFYSNIIELNIKVQGWKEKTTNDAEILMDRLLKRVGYQGTNLSGLQGVKQGCIELTYVLLEPIDASAFSNKELFDTYETNGILSISADHIIVYSKEDISPVKVC